MRFWSAKADSVRSTPTPAELPRSLSERFVLGAVIFAITSTCTLTYFYFARRSLIPDVAWLIEASRRWMSGERLYVDIIEVNPPLIFYDMVALTGGVLTQRAYVLGVSTAMMISSLWVLRLRGSRLALGSLIAMLVGGLTDFGQRDHLALIFVIPVLLGERASQRERIALGLWSFFGVGLKPYLLMMPLAAAFCRAALVRSIRPLFSAQWITLSAACAVYVAWVATVHSAYLSEIVPLGRFVYWAYGAPLQHSLLALSIVGLTTAAVPFLAKDKELMPLAAATAGAIASFYIQGRFWSYHLVPAVGLVIVLAIAIAGRLKVAYVLAGTIVLAQFLRGPHPGGPPHVIPSGVRTVAFIVPHVFGAYPEALECGVRNATRYPAIWVVPGAWNIAHDSSRSPADRARAVRILAHERETILGDFATWKPELIFVDAREHKPYYNYPIDYVAFLNGLKGYRKTGHIWLYDVWTRDRAPVRALKWPSDRPCQNLTRPQR